MGMAASQARFLGLTARKTNTEYEGQQVNQQRTALANESAGLYNKMMTLQVPTPPDTNNFYNMRYTYTVGAESYEITNYAPSSTLPGTYQITVLDKTSVDKAYKQDVNNVNLHRDPATGNYTINVGSINTPLTKITKQNLATEMGLTNPDFYTYTDASQKSYYINAADFNTYTANATADYTGTTSQYYYQATQQSNYKTVDGVTFAVDSNGAFTQINVPNQGTMTLNNERVRDDVGYETAMRNYTMDKDAYDKAISDINAQTSVIQQQDRTLELRLKQLDTEQQALQTEMDAVSKVIDKNIESTFKTFA